MDYMRRWLTDPVGYNTTASIWDSINNRMTFNLAQIANTTQFGYADRTTDMTPPATVYQKDSVTGVCTMLSPATAGWGATVVLRQFKANDPAVTGFATDLYPTPLKVTK